jgi:hypothetical protein
MEDTVKFALTILFAALLIIPACNRNEPRNTQAASEDRPNATEQMKNERDDYVKSIDARLAEFDQKVDGLDERASAMNGTTKTNFKKSIDQLRDQRKDVDSKLSDLKSVSAESWTTMKGDVDAALANLDRSFDQVSSMYENLPGSTAPRTKSHR